MNSLDSRFLRLGDCFAQKFSAPGTYKFIVTSRGDSCASAAEGDYTIAVAARSAPFTNSHEGSQHTVTVHLQDGRLVASPAHLEINAGDTVLWHTPHPETPGFVVIGEGEAGSFSSGALSIESVYSHAFGNPGTYSWVDANGSPVQGEIHVERTNLGHPEDCRKWIEALNQATFVKIVGNKVEPSKVKILAGQTVFFAIENATGISITDARFVSGQVAR